MASRARVTSGVAVAVALALTGGSLSSCSTPGESYCEVVAENRREFNQMAEEGTQYGLITHLPMLRDLAQAAPRDLTDEWQVFLGAVNQLADAIEATGHRVEEFADGALPEGLSAAEKASITAAVERLQDSDTARAAQGIEQQARDVCKVNLGR